MKLLLFTFLLLFVAQVYAQKKYVDPNEKEKKSLIEEPEKAEITAPHGLSYPGAEEVTVPSEDEKEKSKKETKK